MRKWLFKNKSVVATGITVVCLVVGGVSFLRPNTFHLFPDSKAYIDTYHEGIDSAYSSARIERKNDQLNFFYELSSTVTEPFAAVFFRPDSTFKTFYDLSRYDEITVELEASRSDRIPLTFTLDYEGFTDNAVELSNVPFTKVVEYRKDKSVYTFKLTEFEIPSWWHRYHKTKENDFPRPDFARVNYFVIGSCQLIGQGGRDEISIRSIRLVEHNLPLVLGAGLVILAVWLGVLIMVLWNRNSSVVVAYVPAEVIDHDQVQQDELLAFLAANYTNPELTVALTAKETGVSSRNVSAKLKASTGMSFNEYLNELRVHEAMRLLKETGSPVSDIAYSVGYGNVSHFNRVFKQQVGQNPNDFRK